MTRYKYSPERLAAAVASNTSMSGVLRELGIRITGGNFTHLKRRVVAAGLDTSHFTGQAHLRGRHSSNRKTVDQIFVRLPEGGRKTDLAQLRRALKEIGVPYACQICEISTWQEKPLVLQIDHIDGEWLNNERENLRYLCPNCHSQTENYGWKNSAQGRIRTDTASDHRV